MSSKWQTVQIDSVCSLIVDCVNKTAPVVDGPTPFRMIRTTNIRNGRIDTSDCRFVEEETFAKWTRRALLRRGDVVLTREAPIGEVGFVQEPEGFFLGQRVMQYRADPKTLSPRFLLYSFLSPALQSQFGSHEGSGSVVSHIRVGDCFKFKLTLPPLAVQEEIASTLGAIDDRIALLRETNTTLEAIAQALFKSWFVDFDPVRAKSQGLAPAGMDEATAALFPASIEGSPLGPVPAGWTASRVEDVAERVGMGPFGSNIKVSTFVGAGVPVISGSHLHQTLLEDLQFNYVTEEHALRLRNSCVGSGDIVFTHAGTIGQVSLVPGEARFEKYILSQRQFYLRCNEGKMPPAWMTYFFKSQTGQHLLLANASQVGVPSISRPVTNLRSIQFVLPHLGLLRRFSEIVETMHQRVVANRQQAQTLATLRDTLLPRLISGHLRLPDAEALAD